MEGAGAATRYTTLLPGIEHRHELDIKRSRFITVLRRAASEDEARAHVAELRKEFHDARHHCSAFVLGPDRSIQRSSDDGEPSGTAGIPMLEALLRRRTGDDRTDLSDISAVVVRYFGGVLLGAGGLVRAYSESVSAALDTAPLAERRRLRLFTVPVPITGAGRLENDLRSAGVLVRETDYRADGATLAVALEDSARSVEEFSFRLAAVTGGGVEPRPAGLEWVDLR